LGTIDIDITEQKFARKFSLYYKLSILIGMDSLCYLITDKHQQLLAYRKYSGLTQPLNQHIERIFREEPLFRRGYGEVRIAFFHPSATFIPNRLYDEKAGALYLQHLTDPPESSLTLASELPEADAMVVFSIPRFLHQTLRQYFPRAPIGHLNGALCSGFTRVAQGRLGNQVFLHIFERYVHIFLFDGDELQYNNAFRFESAKDFIYYVMLIFQQFQLNPASVPVLFSGSLVEDSEIYRILYKYVRQLKPVAPVNYHSFGESFAAEMAPYMVFDLLSLEYLRP
jgi:hypothetical protein